MPALTRRQFLTRALLAGAGTSLAYAPNIISPPKVSAEDSDVDPGFIAGTVQAISGNTLTVLDVDEQVQTAQLDTSSRIWKKGNWDSLPLTVGDCTYLRGTPGAGGVLIERAWVDIYNLSGGLETTVPELGDFIQGVPNLNLRLDNGYVEPVVVTPDTQIQVSNERGNGDLSALAPHARIQMIAYGPSGPGPLTATLIMVSPGAETPSDTESVADGPIRRGLASWYCCGGKTACGAKCCKCEPPRCCPPLSGGGSCGTCRTNRKQMAWPKLANTDCQLCEGECCDFLGTAFCGDNATVTNPCNGKSIANVKVADCGPGAHTADPVGCRRRSCRITDLTACTFSAIGDLDAGIINVNVQF